MTRAELVAQIQQYLGNRAAPTDDSDWYEERVADGYQFLTTYRDKSGRQPIKFPELQDVGDFTTDSHSEESNIIQLSGAAFGSSIRTIIAIRNTTTGRLMRKVGREFFYKKAVDDDGAATRWAPYSTATDPPNTSVESFLCWRNPPAGTEFRIYYYRKAENLPLAGTTPVLKIDWHPAIAMAGAMIGAGLFGMDDTAAKMATMFAGFVDGKTTGDEDSRAGGIQSFRVGPQAYTVPSRGGRRR